MSVYSNCEGHVWRHVPMWPTKNGWLYFERPTGKYEDLVKGVGDFCDGKDFFELSQQEPGFRGNGYVKMLGENHAFQGVVAS